MDCKDGLAINIYAFWVMLKITIFIFQLSNNADAAVQINQSLDQSLLKSGLKLVYQNQQF
jgi:hypothetical protein